MTPEEHLALATINPELDEILKRNPIVDGLDASTDIVALRKVLLARKKELTSASASQGEATYVEEDRQVPVRDGSTITIRIHSPKTPPEDGSPVFVVYHGGGFCLGGLENETLLCRKFTELGGVAVNVDYRLAPEHPFPVPVEDAFDTLKWTAANISQLGGNPTKGFIVGGISAGANFAIVLTHLYRDAQLTPPLTGAYLSIPACISPEVVPEKYKHVYLSREQNRTAPILNDDSMALFEKLYKPDRISPLRSPIVFPSHANLPPSYFQICGMDPLRDEALIYEDILRTQEKVRTLVDLYPGLPHGFWGWWPEADFSRKFQQDCVKGLTWLLGNASDK